MYTRVGGRVAAVRAFKTLHNGPRNWLHHLAPLASVLNLTIIGHHLNLAIRLRHLPFTSWKCCHNMMPHPLFANIDHRVVPSALVANLATYIDYKLGHQVALLALISNLATGCSTCTNCKLSHQVALLVTVANLATWWHHLHWLKVWSSESATCPIGIISCIELVFSSARVTSVKSQQALFVS